MFAAAAAALTLVGVGVSAPALAITGGYVATASWMGEVHGTESATETFTCSGSQIAASWVLTADHCQTPTSVAFSDSVGGYNGTGIAIDQAVHSTVGDIQVLHLVTPHTLASYPPVNLNDIGTNSGNGDTVHPHSGTIWGLGQPNVGVLYSGQISLFPYGAPEPYVDAKGGLTARNGGASGGPAISSLGYGVESAYQVQGIPAAAQAGDSGGPLLVNGQIVGVDSWGQPNSLNIYARVSASAALIGSVLATTPATVTDSVTKRGDTTYTTTNWSTVINKNSGLIAALTPATGAEIHQQVAATPITTASQNWHIKAAGDGYVKIINSASGQLFSVSGGSMSSAAQIIEWPDSGTADQLWLPVPDAATGYVEYINKNSGQALSVSNGSTAAGGTLIQWPYNHTADQLWKTSLAHGSTVAVRHPIAVY